MLERAEEDLDRLGAVLTSAHTLTVSEDLTLIGALAGNGRSRILRAPGTRDSGNVLLVRSPDGPIVGVHLIGEDVGELIAEGALMVGWQATPEDVAGIVHPHPTLSEAIAEANWSLAGRPLHAHD